MKDYCVSQEFFFSFFASVLFDVQIIRRHNRHLWNETHLYCPEYMWMHWNEFFSSHIYLCTLIMDLQALSCVPASSASPVSRGPAAHRQNFSMIILVSVNPFLHTILPVVMTRFICRNLFFENLLPPMITLRLPNFPALMWSLQWEASAP